jgi:hypothetical protein
MPFSRWLDAIDDAIVRLTDNQDEDEAADAVNIAVTTTRSQPSSHNHVDVGSASSNAPTAAAPSPPVPPPTRTRTSTGEDTETSSNMQRLPGRVHIGRPQPLQQTGRPASNAVSDGTSTTELQGNHNSVPQEESTTCTTVYDESCRTAIQTSPSKANFGGTKTRDEGDDASQTLEHLGSLSYGKEGKQEHQHQYQHQEATSLVLLSSNVNAEATAGSRVLSMNTHSNGEEAEANANESQSLHTHSPAPAHTPAPLLLPPPPPFLSDAQPQPQQAQENMNINTHTTLDSYYLSSTSTPYTSQPLTTTLPRNENETSLAHAPPRQQDLNVHADMHIRTVASLHEHHPPRLPPPPPPRPVAPLNPHQLEAEAPAPLTDIFSATYRHARTAPYSHSSTEMRPGHWLPEESETSRDIQSQSQPPLQTVSKTSTSTMLGVPADHDIPVDAVQSVTSNSNDTHTHPAEVEVEASAVAVAEASKGLLISVAGGSNTNHALRVAANNRGDTNDKIGNSLASSAMQDVIHTTASASVSQPTLLSSDQIMTQIIPVSKSSTARTVPMPPPFPTPLSKSNNTNTKLLTSTTMHPSKEPPRGKISNTELPTRTTTAPLRPALTLKQRAAPPSPVPGRTVAVPRRPRAQRSTLLRNVNPPPGMAPPMAPSTLTTTGTSTSRPSAVDAIAVARVSERTDTGVLARPLPEQQQQSRQPLLVLNSQQQQPQEVNTIADASSSASVGSRSIVVEYENEYFYDSEAELDSGHSFDDDDDDDSSSCSSLSQSLPDMERDASVAIVRNPEFDHWATTTNTTSGLRHGNLEEEDVDANANSNCNCHGVIHVRFVKAYNLPCSEKTTIQPVLSLPPWKGCIRAERVVTAKSKVRGMHAAWTTCMTKQPGDQKGDEEEEEDEMSELSDVGLDTSRDNINDVDVPLHSTDTRTFSMSEREGSDDKYTKTNDRSQYYSMVHDYNNEDTPIPSICLELMSISLFENLVSSVKISCLALIEQPDMVFRKWFVMEMPNAAKGTDTIIEEQGQDGASSEVEPDPVDQFRRVTDPLVLLDIWFEPSAGCKTDNYVLPSNKATASDDVSSIMPSSILGKGDRDAHAHRPKAHLFRIRSYWTPAYCALCSAVLTMRKGYRCEGKNCGLDCCANCLLSIDVRLPCGSVEARRVVKDCIQSKLSFGHVMQIVAPVLSEEDQAQTAEQENDATSAEGHNLTLAQNGSLQPQVANANEPHTTETEHVTSTKVLKSGIGTLRLQIEKAVLFKYASPPEAYLEDILTSSNVQTKDGGDHFVRVSWDNGRESVRTRTVHQTSKPNFGDEGLMEFTVPHYGAEFKIEVIDANTDRPIGSYLLSAQEVLQSQHDSFATSEALELKLKLKQLTDARAVPVEFHRMTAELRSGVKSGFGLDFYSSVSNKSHAEAEVEQDSSRPGT